jgi:hypothetical protein
MINTFWHTVRLPVDMFRTDIDFERDHMQHWDYLPYKGYKSMTFKLEEFVREEFMSWFWHLGLPLMPWQMLFATAPGYQGYLHKDTHPFQQWNGRHCHATLNYHLTKTTGSLVWYDCPEQGEDWTTESGTPAERYALEGRREIGRWQGPEPALCRVDQAHISDNLMGTEPRVVVSLRFILNPDWDHVLEKLRPWIV